MTIVSWFPGAARAQWREPRSETGFVELGVGLSGEVQDAYARRQGYHPGMTGAGPTVALSIGTMFPSSRQGPDFGLVLRWERLEHREHVHPASGHDQEVMNWTTSAASFGVRLRQRLAREWLAVYGQLQGGLAYTRMETGYEPVTSERMVRGLSVGGLTALAANFGHVGVFMEGGYTYAPVLEDAAGNRHNDGGGCFLMGVRGRLVTKL